MKRIAQLGLIIAAAALPAMLMAQVETSAGKLAVGGKLKWMWMYQAQQDKAVGASGTMGGIQAGQRWFLDGKGIDQFTASSVELDLQGSAGENVAYLVELQASWFPAGPGGGFGGLAGFASPGEIQGSRLGVRQAKIVITGLIPMTTVTLGTFNPPLGTYQARATNDWGLIALPLMNMALFGNAGNGTSGPGRAFAPIGLGWQATGVDIRVQPADAVAVHLAYFNGGANGSFFGGRNVNQDRDLEKSWYLKLELNPVEGAQIGVAYLHEGWQENLNTKASNEEQQAQGWVVNAGYRNDRLDLNLDWMTMTAAHYQHGQGAWGHWQDLTWMAWQVTAGIWVTEQLEILARYDWADPNTANNRFRAAPRVPGPPVVNNYTYLAQNDALTIWTLGANVRVGANAELALNYLWINEQGLPIDEKKFARGKTKYGAGNGQGRRQQLDNDTFLLQVQLWQ